MIVLCDTRITINFQDSVTQWKMTSLILIFRATVKRFVNLDGGHTNLYYLIMAVTTLVEGKNTNHVGHFCRVCQGDCHSCMHSLPVFLTVKFELCSEDYFSFPSFFSFPYSSYSKTYLVGWPWGSLVGGSIAFPSLLPFLILLIFVVFCPYLFMGLFTFLLFYGCLKHRFPDVKKNPCLLVVPRVKCRIMLSNIYGLHGNLEDLAVAASGFDIVVCAETKVSGCRHVSELLIPGFSSPMMLLRDDQMVWVWRCMLALTCLSLDSELVRVCACCEFIVFNLLLPNGTVLPAVPKFRF